MDKEQKGKAAASETTAQPPQNAVLLANRYYQVHSAESSQKNAFWPFFVDFCSKICLPRETAERYLTEVKSVAKNKKTLHLKPKISMIL